MNDTAAVIRETVLRCLKAQGLTVIRISDTTFGSAEGDERFARDVAGNAAMVLSADPMPADAESMWSPAHGGNQ